MDHPHERTIAQDNARTAYAAMKDAEFDRKAEKMLAGQREVPNGRNFLSWTMRFQNDPAYVSRFDNTFKDAPGSKSRMDREFCPKCDKRKVFCECK